MEDDGRFPFVLEQGEEYLLNVRDNFFPTFARYEGAREGRFGTEHDFVTTRHINAGTPFTLMEPEISYVRKPLDY